MRLRLLCNLSLASILALLLSAPQWATAQTTSLIFERADIRVESPELTGKEKNPKPPHAPAAYSIELRGEDAMKLEYIHTLNTLGDGSGVMIAFTNPAMVALPAMKVYNPVDVLFIAEDGTVLQIMPAVTLGEITQNLQARTAVKAFLFLKNGEAAARELHPRDRVVGSMFTPPLPVQE